MMLRKKKTEETQITKTSIIVITPQQFMQFSVKIRTDIINKCMLNFDNIVRKKSHEEM